MTPCQTRRDQVAYTDRMMEEISTGPARGTRPVAARPPSRPADAATPRATQRVAAAFAGSARDRAGLGDVVANLSAASSSGVSNREDVPWPVQPNPRRWATSRHQRRGRCRLAQMREDLAHGHGVVDESDDAHLGRWLLWSLSLPLGRAVLRHRQRLHLAVLCP